MWQSLRWNVVFSYRCLSTFLITNANCIHCAFGFSFALCGHSLHSMFHGVNYKMGTKRSRHDRRHIQWKQIEMEMRWVETDCGFVIGWHCRMAARIMYGDYCSLNRMKWEYFADQLQLSSRSNWSCNALKTRSWSIFYSLLDSRWFIGISFNSFYVKLSFLNS